MPKKQKLTKGEWLALAEGFRAAHGGIWRTMVSLFSVDRRAATLFRRALADLSKARSRLEDVMYLQLPDWTDRDAKIGVFYGPGWTDQAEGSATHVAAEREKAND